MKNLAKKRILKVKPYKPGKPIEEVRRELGLKKVIKLASNESMLSPSPIVRKAIVSAIKDLNRYPESGCFYLKKALSKKFNFRPDNIITGNGSDELIVLAIRAFCEQGDEVIIADPTFLVYEIASSIEGLKIVKVPLKDYRYDIKSIADRANRKTKMIFIANPDNPTGSYATAQEIRTLLGKIGPDTIVFFDEAYYEFAKGQKDYPDTLKYIKNKNVIVSRTFSKAYGLAGLRVGYAFANKRIIEAMNKVREPFNVNSLAQIAACAALKDNERVKKILKLVSKGKTFISSRLTDMGFEVMPSAANFVLIKAGKESKNIYRGLLRKGVIVREMSAWKLEGFLRVNIGTMRENKAFISALKNILEK